MKLLLVVKGHERLLLIQIELQVVVGDVIVVVVDLHVGSGICQSVQASHAIV